MACSLVMKIHIVMGSHSLLIHLVAVDFQEWWHPRLTNSALPVMHLVSSVHRFDMHSMCGFSLLFFKTVNEYEPVNSTLVFNADSLTSRRICRNLSINADTVLEEIEPFTLTLSTSDPAVQTPQSSAVVHIMDSNGMWNSSLVGLRIEPGRIATVLVARKL